MLPRINAGGILRRGHMRAGWVLALVPSCFVLLITLAQRLPISNGDSVALARSARALVTCGQQREWHGCVGAAQFGVLQHLPASFLAWKGLDDHAILVGLALLSAASLAGVLVLAARFPECGGRRRLLLVATMVFGPLVAYAASTFGEMLTTLVFVAFAAALVSRRPLPVLLLGFLAAGTREPAFAPLLLFAAAALLGTTGDDRARDVRVGAAAIVGLASGTISILALNYWRYETWENLVHSDPDLQAPGLLLRANLAAGVWTAPGGGVLPYWLLGGAVALALPLTALVLRHADRRAQAAPALLVLALGLQTAGLASWFAPYGWVAWGPRLMMPTVALGTCLAVALCPDALAWWWSAARRHLLLAGAFGAACVVSASASYGYVRAPAVANSFFALDATCPSPAIIQDEPGYYFHCLLYGSWWKWPTLWWYGFQELWQSVEGMLLAAGLVLAAISAVVRLAPDPEPEPVLVAAAPPE